MSIASIPCGLDAVSRYLSLVTTNGQLRLEEETERERTYSCSYLDADGRGQELALQFSTALFLARAREGTGRPVVPAHVAFAQPAPRSYRVFTEMLSTRRIDFGAPVTTFTLRTSDLDLPLRDADPALASILRRHAASLPPSAVVTWLHHFRRQLSEAIEQGSPSLAALARRMSLSSRTLQRRLAEHGTTWRAELDAARQYRAQRARRAGSPSMTQLARQLGYTHPRSARRALRRWDHPATQATADRTPV